MPIPFKFMDSVDADVFCVQETKMQREITKYKNDNPLFE